jgi:hypothetical protein
MSDTIMENTSGQGVSATVPGEIDKWNWGAFLLNWIWGIGNNTYIAFLMFVPLVNFIMPFVLGAKGSSWAWRNKRWDSVEEFKAVQRKWARWGVAVLALAGAFIVSLFFIIAGSLKSSDVYKLAVAKLEKSQEIAQLVGLPMSTGMPTGSFEVSGPRGRASFSFSISGPIGKGVVFLEATRDLGLWKIRRMVFEQDGTGRRIDLIDDSADSPARNAPNSAPFRPTI